MEELYKKSGFILSFLCLTLLVQLLMGDKFTEKFLQGVMLSMAILNYNKFADFLSDHFTLKGD